MTVNFVDLLVAVIIVLFSIKCVIVNGVSVNGTVKYQVIKRNWLNCRLSLLKLIRN